LRIKARSVIVKLVASAVNFKKRRNGTDGRSRQATPFAVPGAGARDGVLMVVCAPVVDLPQPSRGGFLAEESETLD
jgi:hypothetical protein